MGDEDSLDNFIKHYRLQLARERMELVSNSMFSWNQAINVSGASNDELYTTNSRFVTPFPESANSPNPGLHPLGRHQSEEADNRTFLFQREEGQQTDLRPSLDRQLEKRLIHPTDNMEKLPQSSLTVIPRSQSPPIKSHYNMFHQSPSSSRSARNKQLNDLTEPTPSIGQLKKLFFE